MAQPTPADNPAATHPLQFKWTLWHDVAEKKNKAANYAANLREVASFDTVEDFWALFNNLKEPTQLEPGNTYNLFKCGIEPKWEDSANERGGEWRVSVPSSRSDLLDDYWMNTVLSVIGENFSPDESDDIAGIVLNRKRGMDRIAIWTKTAANEGLQTRLGAHWRSVASILPRMEYMSFEDAMSKQRSRPKARYVLEGSHGNE